MRTTNHSGISLFLAALFIFAAPAVGHAQNLFRFYPELALNGFYGDNVALRTSNEIGDFGSTMFGGFYLDYTSAARYASLHWDTFAQLFTHETKFDRAGEGQFVSLTDDENLSRTTKLRLDEFFGRDSPGYLGVITGGQAPQFDLISAQLLLASDQAKANYFTASLLHDWGRQWSSYLSVHQETFWEGGSNNTSSTSYEQIIDTYTVYEFANHVALGGGYRFYDFRFSAPGVPDEQAHWPYASVTWLPMEHLYFHGYVGVVISHTEGINKAEVNPGGEAVLEYTLQRARLRIDGGEHPEVTGGLSGVSKYRFAAGNIFYEFTPRLTGIAGGGYYEMVGDTFDGQLVSWGLGLTERVNKWLVAYTRFVEVRRTENAANQFIPSGSESGKTAVGNYISVGLSASIEAFRWSWQ
jgi:hypothetical protein